MARVYIPLWMIENTFAVGIYSSEKEAEEAVVNYLITKRREEHKRLLSAVKHEFEISLEDREALRTAIFDSDISDFISENIIFTMETGREGTLFRFTDWEKWDMHNLYRLLDGLLAERTGALY